MSEERCVMCGDIIPEGRQICPWCACGIKGDDSPSRTADNVVQKGETKTMDFYMMIRALDEKSRKIGLTEKERLEKLIYEGLYEMQGAVVIGLNGGYGMLADYLMSEGVIVPPCKVGDKAWIMLMRDDDIVPARVALIEYDAYTNPHMWIGFEYEDEVGEICLRRMRVDICYGKRAFRTRGAAETELERRKNET